MRNKGGCLLSLSCISFFFWKIFVCQLISRASDFRALRLKLPTKIRHHEDGYRPESALHSHASVSQRCAHCMCEPCPCEQRPRVTEQATAAPWHPCRAAVGPPPPTCASLPLLRRGRGRERAEPWEMGKTTASESFTGHLSLFLSKLSSAAVSQNNNKKRKGKEGKDTCIVALPRNTQGE
jgi:hypothetical protein